LSSISASLYCGYFSTIAISVLTASSLPTYCLLFKLSLHSFNSCGKGGGLGAFHRRAPD
jgi:hypothetical protein